MIGWTKIFDQVSKIQVKSITDTLFKYFAIMFVIATISSIFKAPEWVTILQFSVGGLLLLFALIFYAYFSLKNPDYLRSETFQITKQSIEMLGDKNHVMNPNIKEIKYITNPLSRQIEEDTNYNKNFGEQK